MKTKTGTGHPTGRVTKQQWLAAALDMFASAGDESVRVAELARSLCISKSGFYWHFRDRDDLLDEMKAYWVDEYSQRGNVPRDVEKGVAALPALSL